MSLDEGREWFTAAWGAVPERAGRDTAAILASMAGEEPRGGEDGEDGVDAAAAHRDAGVRALILLGADPLSDFPDHAVAAKALSSGHFVVAVTGHPSQSVDQHADVVLPCAVAHERPGRRPTWKGGSAGSAPSSPRPASPGPTG